MLWLRKRKNKQWKPGIRCRYFGHDFVSTGLGADMPLFGSVSVEECSLCGAGRVSTPLGEHLFTPKFITDLRTAAIDNPPPSKSQIANQTPPVENKVIQLKDRR